MTGKDDHYLSCIRKDWPNIHDKVTKALEEALLKGQSHSSSGIMKFNLNELPPLDTDDEDHNEAKRRDHKVCSGASSSRLCNNIDLNKSPREEPPNHDDQNNITKNLLNPKPLKRRGRSSGRKKKAKKQRLDVELVVENATFIYEKTLSVSDVNPNQSRFLIPFKKLKRNDFLTQEESSFLEQGEKGKKHGLKVFLVNQRSETWSLVFKRWVMKKKKKKNSQKGSLNYVLNCGWNDIVEDNNLKAKDKISLWSFRSDGVLCFSLVTHPPTINT